MSAFNVYPVEIFTLIFLILTFLLSSFEKISDWKGSVSYIKNHFKRSPLKGSVPVLLGILLILELLSCSFMIIGLYNLIKHGLKETALIGVEISCISLIFMLIGQRLAKDYTGAMNISIYFIINIIAIYFLK